MLFRSGSVFMHRIEAGRTALAYCIEGQAVFAPDVGIGNRQVVLFDDGDHVRIETSERPVRFLLLSGQPLSEPIAWRGPIVMNTTEELEVAFREYRDGSFVKVGEVPGG